MKTRNDTELKQSAELGADDASVEAPGTDFNEQLAEYLDLKRAQYEAELVEEKAAGETDEAGLVQYKPGLVQYKPGLVQKSTDLDEDELEVEYIATADLIAKIDDAPAQGVDTITIPLRLYSWREISELREHVDVHGFPQGVKIVLDDSEINDEVKWCVDNLKESLHRNAQYHALVNYLEEPYPGLNVRIDGIMRTRYDNEHKLNLADAFIRVIKQGKLAPNTKIYFGGSLFGNLGGNTTCALLDFAEAKRVVLALDKSTIPAAVNIDMSKFTLHGNARGLQVWMRRLMDEAEAANDRLALATLASGGFFDRDYTGEGDKPIAPVYYGIFAELKDKRFGPKFVKSRDANANLQGAENDPQIKIREDYEVAKGLQKDKIKQRTNSAWWGRMFKYAAVGTAATVATFAALAALSKSSSE